jgi:CelD/BcsL family acetyltransferase involved in cellulose biosynthesis
MTDQPLVLTRPDELRSIESAWRELALGPGGTSYFGSPDWVLSWWETLGGGVPGAVAVWSDGGDGLSAVVPLGRTGQRLHPRIPGSVHVLANLGGGPGSADHGGFSVGDGAEPAVRQWLEQMGRDRTLLLQDLDPLPAARLLPSRARVVRRNVCPRLTIPDDHDAIGGSAKMRKQIRAYARRLQREGIGFRWVPPGQVDGRVLDTLFALHAVRSEDARRRSSFDADRRQLHDSLAARARDGFGPAAVVAERDGFALGVLYGFRWRDHFAYFQSGWRPEAARLNLGTVLVAEAIRFAAEDGARVFDFLRGPEPYKYRFGAVDRADLTYLVPRGTAGALLRLKYRAKRGTVSAGRLPHAPPRDPDVPSDRVGRPVITAD